MQRSRRGCTRSNTIRCRNCCGRRATPGCSRWSCIVAGGIREEFSARFCCTVSSVWLGGGTVGVIVHERRVRRRPSAAGRGRGAGDRPARRVLGRRLPAAPLVRRADGQPRRVRSAADSAVSRRTGDAGLRPVSCSGSSTDRPHRPAAGGSAIHSSISGCRRASLRRKALIEVRANAKILPQRLAQMPLVDARPRERGVEGRRQSGTERAPQRLRDRSLGRRFRRRVAIDLREHQLTIDQLRQNRADRVGVACASSAAPDRARR